MTAVIIFLNNYCNQREHDIDGHSKQLILWHLFKIISVKYLISAYLGVRLHILWGQGGKGGPVVALLTGFSMVQTVWFPPQT